MNIKYPVKCAKLDRMMPFRIPFKEPRLTEIYSCDQKNNARFGRIFD